MDLPTHLSQGLARARNLSALTALLAAALVIAGCGGGSQTTTNETLAACDPGDATTLDECGTLLVGLTDADGDFLNYTVDVTSLTLETANGRVIETMPRTTRINFSDYVDLTELVTAATIPPGVYVAGTISLDYSSAEIYVEADGMSKQAVVVDDSGTAFTQTSLGIRLSDRDQLTIRRGRPAFLQLDFDLDASHEVNIVPTPAVAISQPFIVAEVSPVDEKDIRVRGPLLEVDEEDASYVVAIRPFRNRDGDFGRVTVNTTEQTEFEVDGLAYEAADGLRALAAAGPGTATVAFGTLDVSDREFTATIVLAGSSVPGSDADAVLGSVIARDGNFLTIRGATVHPSDRRAHFHDDVVVEVGPDTRVVKDGNRGEQLGIDAISIGQRVTIRGDQPIASTDANAPQILFDATAGAVRLHLTKVSGVVNTVMPGQVDITLQSIDRRRVSVFDFSGTGTSGDEDADPANYEIATGELVLAPLAEGKPIVASGFATAFGAAPPDFTGRTVVDYSDVRSALGIGWGAAGTAEPFLSIGTDGLLLNNSNPDIDGRHFIKQGPVLIDLETLPSDTLIVPRPTDRKLFWISSGDSLRQYSDFGDFVEDLTGSLDGATTARSMFARGRYDADSNVFTAYKIGVHLLEP